MLYGNVTQQVLFDNAVLAALMYGRKSYLKMAYSGFSKESPLSECNVATELNMEKIYLQIVLFYFG